jgi:hypothetical protein
MKCTYKCNIEARSRNHFCSGKVISIKYSECVSVALVIQHTKRMRCIILSSVACLAVPCFSALSHTRRDFRENVIERKMCVLIFSATFVWVFIIWRRIRRDTVVNVHRFLCKIPVVLCRNLTKLGFYRQILKNPEISNVIKIRPVRVELFHADGQTWRSWQSLLTILRTRLRAMPEVRMCDVATALTLLNLLSWNDVGFVVIDLSKIRILFFCIM